MEKLVPWLDKLIAIEDKALAVKPRVTNTIGSAVKVFKAASAADLGNTERAVIDRLLQASVKAQALIG